MHFYTFKPRGKALLTFNSAKRILEANKPGEIKVSLDLGMSTQLISIDREKVKFPNGETVALKKLGGLKDKRAVYVVNGDIFKVAFFKDGNYYKLVNIKDNVAPTLEINGIHMHRVKRITPWKDSQEKIACLGIRRGTGFWIFAQGLDTQLSLDTQKAKLNFTQLKKI